MDNINLKSDDKEEEKEEKKEDDEYGGINDIQIAIVYDDQTNEIQENILNLTIEHLGDFFSQIPSTLEVSNDHNFQGKSAYYHLREQHSPRRKRLDQHPRSHLEDFIL